MADTQETHRGLPVPWAARRTGEVESGVTITLEMRAGRPRLVYTDGLDTTRDEHGVLWHRENLDRSGEPQFGQLSAKRQRSCMLHGRCQVCGHKIVERPIRWLMNATQLWNHDDGSTLTLSPPTCSSCVEVALDLCPHLKSGDPIVVKVLEYRIWGVIGEVITPDPKRPGFVLRTKDVTVPYTSRSLGAILARQQVVEFTKFVRES